MGNSQERPSETIDRERKRLVETLQADSGLLLDALLARGVLAGPEYEALDALPDAERRVRRLLLLVQSKGEAACQELLLCAQRTARAPDPAWDWQHVGTGEPAGRGLRPGRGAGGARGGRGGVRNRGAVSRLGSGSGILQRRKVSLGYPRLPSRLPGTQLGRCVRWPLDA